jgi:CDK-activating kinase assembly factor MAT1
MTSRTSVGGWLRGKTIKRAGAGSSNHTRSSTPQQVQSTSTTVFGGGVKDPSGRVSEFFVSFNYLYTRRSLMSWQSMDDQCPVCKSDRYLNPKLRLLVSSCYHKMCVCKPSFTNPPNSNKIEISRCESCIDRLFTLGPAPCPICNKILRKLAFTPQTFEDLGVEKEVAIRRRVAKECVDISCQTPFIYRLTQIQ